MTVLVHVYGPEGAPISCEMQMPDMTALNPRTVGNITRNAVIKYMQQKIDKRAEKTDASL